MNKTFQSLVVLFVVSFSLSPFLVPHAETAEATEDSWTTKAPLPVALAGLKAATVNEKIYVIKLNITYEYNLYSWSTKTSMPTPRDAFGIATYQNKIYVIGGRTYNSDTGINQVYDPLTDSWETKTSMPTPRHGLDANIVNGKIYLISGLVPYSGYQVRTDVNEVYDPESDSWTTKTAIPNPVSYYSSAVVNNKIYVVSEDLTQIYDPESDNWSFGTPPPHQVDMAGGTATTGVLAPKRIYVIGGRESGLEVPYTQVYNPIYDLWSLGTPIPTPRYDFATAVVDDQIYTMGGLTGAFTVIEQKNQNEQYTPIGYGTIPPRVSVVSPENKIHTSIDVPLIFTVNEQTSWIGYSLDGQANVTITGNTTLTGLSYGSHNLIVYANDTDGNTGTSETIYFTIETPPFPTTLLVAAIVIIAVVGAVLLVYFRKFRKTTGEEKQLLRK